MSRSPLQISFTPRCKPMPTQPSTAGQLLAAARPRIRIQPSQAGLTAGRPRRSTWPLWLLSLLVLGVIVYSAAAGLVGK